jgi:uncharacterized protein DUF4440
MKKWFLRLFVALMAFLLSVALTGAFKFFFGRHERTFDLENVVAVDPAPFTNFPEDRAQIAEIYSQYGEAQTQHDRAFFQRVEAENFMLFVSGQRLTREEDIQWMERQPSDTTYEVRVHHIRVFGNSAVSRGYMTVTYGNGEQAEWPFIDVWVKQGNMWRIQTTTSSD